MSKRSFAALLLSTAACAGLQARLDARIAPLVAKVPGATILVERDGQLVLAKAYGFADVENDAPAALDTVYCIGSVSKQFGAAAVLQLVEAGKLRLTDKLARFYPDFPRADRISLHMLLNHTSGIADYEYKGEWPKTMSVERSSEEVVAMFRDLPPVFEPGTRWSYSTSNYYLLGRIVEKASGVKLEDYLQRQVIDRAGLRHTSFCDPRALIRRRALGYDVDEKKGFVPAAPVLLNQFGFGGGLCSTAGDLLAWQRALEEGRIVSAASYRQMSTNQLLPDGTPTGYGYGLFPSELANHPLVSHSGGVPGFGAMLAHYLADGVRIAILLNTRDAPLFELEEGIAAELLQLAPPAARPIDREELTRYATRLPYFDGTLELSVVGDTLAQRYLSPEGKGLPPQPLVYIGEGAFESPDHLFKVSLELERGRVARGRIVYGGMTIQARPE